VHLLISAEADASGDARGPCEEEAFPPQRFLLRDMLSADTVFSTKEILDDYRRLCEETAEA
jgi:hypothetical protein